MITDALMDLVAEFLTWLTGVINSAWQAVPDAVQNSMNWFGSLNEWFPVTELATVFGVFAALALFGWTVAFAKKIVDWIPL